MNTRYHPAQIQFLKAHYQHLSNAELAARLGIDTPRKVLDLARRLGLKWRAENGAPQWRHPPRGRARHRGRPPPPAPRAHEAARAASLPMPRRNQLYSMRQVAYLRQHYADLPPTHFAEQWGVTVPRIYALARRHGIKRRAPNGERVWR